MGNHQVSSNLKHALPLLHHGNSTKSSNKKHHGHGPHENRQTLGILCFEVAKVMSKVIHLHRSLSENEILKLQNDILKSEGIKTLISSDEKHILELALEEKLEDLNRVASVVSRLGKKCTIPALQGFEHVYGDIISGAIDIKELAFLVKDMESMVRKMERYVISTATLYTEIGVMNELYLATKKFHQNHNEESRKAFEQKLTWQKQDVGHFKDISLWNQTHDKVVELLARTVTTIYARIYTVFGDNRSGGDDHICNSSSITRSSQVGFSGSFRRAAKCDSVHKSRQLLDVKNDTSLTKTISSKNNGRRRKKGFVGFHHKNEGGTFRPEHFGLACCSVPGRLFMECLSLNSATSKVDYDDDPGSYNGESSRISDGLSVSSGVKRDNSGLSGLLVRSIDRDHPIGESSGRLLNSSKLGPKGRLLGHASSSTVGGSALAIHYSNIIIVLEKFLKYPHLVGNEARDDLYQMLPTSLRERLKISLKSYIEEDLAIYDAPLARNWREMLDRTLKWLVPLAHNMMRWHSERNFEQQQIGKRTNSVVLVQTLYFADREKTEAVICEVLVGLNYICRYEQQRNTLLDDRGSSFDFEEWQSLVDGSFD